MNVPIYIQIKNELKKDIEKGVYQSGEKIPSERELSEQYKISRMTGRQAINELVKEGLVIREKGKGSFVAPPQFLQENIRSFTDTLLEQGYEPSTELLEFNTVYNLKEISRKLDEEPSTYYYKIKRLRFANNLPVALETVYIPKCKCKDLENHNLRGSLYEILKEYGYTIQSISCDIEACLSSKAIMGIFQLKKPTALLKVEGVNYTVDGEKLFYEEAYYKSSMYRYHVDIYKR
ncbi:GntR family transcriptional regulator [Natranaerovirga hydrolytica]|uniref:GntR family transcriptional regulator n=1 Tax=Natranaerovirga hydrolytica TaxID=680378 RepID=A0A4R1N9E1_9FIRM|nr:GntR family transcriptional regulator [Natranaerovirga hydrolytica]TCK99724.1 GntR family transcriptional regulator [Natranaerovirga hydrolytica]